MKFKLISSSYVPYTVPLHYKSYGNVVENVSVTLLRGTSIGLYVDHELWESNVPLTEEIVNAQKSILKNYKFKAGIVTYIDAPETWVRWVGYTAVCGTVLAIRSYLNLDYNVDVVSREVKRVYRVDSWLSKMILSRGLSYMKFEDGRLISHLYTELDPSIRIVVGFRGSGCTKGFGVFSDNPIDTYETLRDRLAEGEGFSITENCGVFVITTRPNLKKTVKRAVKYLGRAEYVVVTQPDNIGVRVYRAGVPA